jgi:hypothetical protein
MASIDAQVSRAYVMRVLISLPVNTTSPPDAVAAGADPPSLPDSDAEADTLGRASARAPADTSAATRREMKGMDVPPGSVSG